jgi:hypothetical protein
MSVAADEVREIFGLAMASTVADRRYKAAHGTHCSGVSMSVAADEVREIFGRAMASTVIDRYKASLSHRRS